MADRAVYVVGEDNAGMGGSGCRANERTVIL